MRDNDSLILESLYERILLKESSDEEYLRLAENPEENKDALQRMVDEAAKITGFWRHAYHYTAERFSVFKEKYEHLSGFYFSPFERGVKNRSGKEEATIRMDVYLKMELPLEMDAFDAQDISPEIKDDIIKNGFDSVIGKDDEVKVEYVVFYPNQIKSSDPVTYDNGNIIPLSQRFDSSNDDIRY